VIPVGGADRFGHVEQLDVFEQLLEQDIDSLELRDRDGATDEHRMALLEKSPRPLHIFEKDSIESYLIEPSVIARVVVEAATERGKDVSFDRSAASSLVMELAEEMKNETFDRVTQRYFDDCTRLGKDRPSAGTANDAARSLLGPAWESLDDVLKPVSGKKLLSAIRRRIQNEHGVNFGNERLAESFTADEIPPEIKDQLDRIASLSAPESEPADASAA
jgi:hypothetical protein